MRQGDNAQIILAKKGGIFAIATGSDACSEHEWGIAPMMKALCSNFAANTKEQLIARVLENPGYQFPNVLDRCTINQRLDEIVFVEGIDEKTKDPSAGIFFNDGIVKKYDINHRELRMRDFGPSRHAAAWDKESFAFRVNGEKMVKKLRHFHERIQSGSCAFASQFFRASSHQALYGVVIADKAEFLPLNKEMVGVAQQDLERMIRCQARIQRDEAARV